VLLLSIIILNTALHMIKGTSSQDENITSSDSKPLIKWIFLTLLAIFLSYITFPMVSSWVSNTPSIERKNISINTVIRGDLIRDVVVSGKAVSANAPQLYSTEVGKITLLAKPGEIVTLNQIVAELTSPELVAIIKQQKSTLEQLSINADRGVLEDKEAQLDFDSKLNTAEAGLNVAKRENQRAEASYAKKIISQVDWLKSKDDLTEAKRSFEHATQRVALAKERLHFESRYRQFQVDKEQLILDELLRRELALIIKAPVAGVVGNWLVAQKNTIQANTPIMTIVDLSEYEAELSVPEFYADDLGIGLSVAMTIAGKKVSGSIIAISPEIKSNQVKVRAQFIDSNSLQLRQNQRIGARIAFEKKEKILMIKRGAFIGSLGGKFAYKVSDGQSANKVPIALGIYSVDYIEILSGVKEGEQLITSDYQKFNQAEKINVSE
jgi:HlyD family secretion protein